MWNNILDYLPIIINWCVIAESPCKSGWGTNYPSSCASKQVNQIPPFIHEQWSRVVHFYKVIAKVCPILKFRTFLESWDDSKSKLFHTFFSKVTLNGTAIALKFWTFCITPKASTLSQNRNTWNNCVLFWGNAKL